MRDRYKSEREGGRRSVWRREEGGGGDGVARIKTRRREDRMEKRGKAGRGGMNLIIVTK